MARRGEKMKKSFLLVIILATLVASGCAGSGIRYKGIQGEMIIAPLSSILSHPVTKEEEPNFYKRRWLNGQPHRNHYRSKDRKWSTTYKLKGGTR